MKFNIWTLLFQITNFIVLLVILKRILYKPVREIMERRRELVERQMREAEQTKREAQELKNRYEEEISDLGDRKIRVLEQLREEMNEERKRLIAEAREEAAKVVAKEKAIVDGERKAVEAEMKDRVLDMVSLFSTNLLKDISDESLHKAVFKRFLDGIGSIMPEIEQTAVEAGSLSIEIAAARPLSDGDVQQVMKIAQSHTMKNVAINTSLEPALIAGVRMKSGDRVFDYSLSGQIHALRKKLGEAR